MNRNSHLGLLVALPTDAEQEKENGIFSKALNSRNQARQSQEVRAPLGEINFQINRVPPQTKLKKKESQIDPTVAIKTKNIR